MGTIFEWYDFYLYATLAPFFAALFFPPGNDTAALLSAFATYAAGFLIRPFGAVIFGRIGDLVGRKYTFLVTIFVMGLATTFAVGLLPTFGTQNLPIVGQVAGIGWTAPVLLVTLRLLQGLALGVNTVAQQLTLPNMPVPVSAATRQAGFKQPPRLASFSRCS